MLVCAFKGSTKEGEAGTQCEFEPSLVYMARSRLARTVQCDPSEKQKSKNKTKQVWQIRVADCGQLSGHSRLLCGI